MDSLTEEFTIHSVNAYMYRFLASLGMPPERKRDLLLSMFNELEATLSAQGISYAELRQALTPQAGRTEAAFVFDSTKAGNLYGWQIADEWIPALRKCGPHKTSVHVGDIIGEIPELLWDELERRLKREGSIPRLSSEQYFVVYMTNLSVSQLQHMHDELVRTSGSYLGVADCSIWNPLKRGMVLPAVTLRVGDAMLTSQVFDDDQPNAIGYPYEASGFHVVGVNEYHYGVFLGHRLDVGRDDLAAEDSETSLALLGGRGVALSEMDIWITGGRLEYLRREKFSALQSVGLEGASGEDLCLAIAEGISYSLIYNLRFKLGSRDGVRDPSLDASMFTAQATILDTCGNARRFQVGFKYSAHDHSAEVLTLY